MAKIHGEKSFNASIFNINGNAVLIPSEITYTRSDLDSENSFRSISGEMQRDRICTKRKIDCTWNALSGGELSALLQAMDDIFFTVYFFDPYLGGYTSMVAYVGDRSVPTAFWSDESNDMIFKSFSASFVEK